MKILSNRLKIVSRYFHEIRIIEDFFLFQNDRFLCPVVRDNLARWIPWSRSVESSIQQAEPTLMKVRLEITRSWKQAWACCLVSWLSVRVRTKNLLRHLFLVSINFCSASTLIKSSRSAALTLISILRKEIWSGWTFFFFTLIYLISTVVPPLFFTCTRLSNPLCMSIGIFHSYLSMDKVNEDMRLKFCQKLRKL